VDEAFEKVLRASKEFERLGLWAFHCKKRKRDVVFWPAARMEGEEGEGMMPMVMIPAPGQGTNVGRVQMEGGCR
jgi:hypothetical protein